MTEEIDNFLDFLKKSGFNTIMADSPSWKVVMDKALDKSMLSAKKQQDEPTPSRRVRVGDLVYHRSVPELGLGLVISESPNHTNYWIIKWCDQRYKDVGQLGINTSHLQVVKQTGK